MGVASKSRGIGCGWVYEACSHRKLRVSESHCYCLHLTLGWDSEQNDDEECFFGAFSVENVRAYFRSICRVFGKYAIQKRRS